MKILKTLFLFALCLRVSALSAENLSKADIEIMAECDVQSDSVKAITESLEHSYQRIKSERKVHAWEMEDRNHRIPHYCMDQCGCLTTELSLDLFKEVFAQSLEISKIRLSGGEGILPVEITIRERKYSYRYHVGLMVQIPSEKCAVLYDPIMSGSENPVQPMTPSDWIGRVQSWDKNKFHSMKVHPI